MYWWPSASHISAPCPRTRSRGLWAALCSGWSRWRASAATRWSVARSRTLMSGPPRGWLPLARVACAVADLLVPAGLLLGAALAALLAAWRRDEIAEAVVAAAGVVALLALLAGGRADDLLAAWIGGARPLEVGPAPPTPGRPLVGLVVTALFSASALRALGAASPSGAGAAATALAAAGASAAA